MNRFCCFLLITLAVGLQGCANISPASRIQHADELAAQAGWHKYTLDTRHFAHRSYSPAQRQHSHLTIYIEGDGLAWISRDKPSSDPTPLNPIALTLALADGRSELAYLARPCQFMQSSQCQQRYWTSARFAEEVIASTDEAISQLKAQRGAQALTLIGYSGGGAVAALVAARRDDVASLITVAGNLDHQAWSKIHHISPLSGSLNPADSWQELADITQTHFVGAQDTTVPLSVAQSFQRRFPTSHFPKLRLVEAADHHCCWLDHWPELLELSR